MWSHRDWPVQQMILRLWNNFWCSCCICSFLPMPTAFPKLLQMILFLKAALHHALPSTLAKVIADLGSGFVLFSKFITVSLIILWKVMKAQPDSPILILHSSGYCRIIEMAGTFTIRAIFKQTFVTFQWRINWARTNRHFTSLSFWSKPHAKLTLYCSWMKWAHFHECGNKTAATQYLLNSAARTF